MRSYMLMNSVVLSIDFPRFPPSITSKYIAHRGPLSLHPLQSRIFPRFRAHEESRGQGRLLTLTQVNRQIERHMPGRLTSGLFPKYHPKSTDKRTDRDCSERD